MAGLCAALRPLAADGGVSLIAHADGTAVGHLLATPALLDAPARLVPVTVISPLGVLPDVQRSGVGSALMREAVARLDAAGAPMVFLEGSPRYYPRFGFVRGASLGFRKPSLRIPDAAFQVLTLSAYDPVMTGTLVYPDVFWKLDCVGLRE